MWLVFSFLDLLLGLIKSRRATVAEKNSPVPLVVTLEPLDSAAAVPAVPVVSEDRESTGAEIVESVESVVEPVVEPDMPSIHISVEDTRPGSS